MVLKVAGGGGGTSGAVNYLGTWNAASNNPTLTSGVGTKGGYYVVSTSGTTTLDGISLWSVGDWAVFNGTVWQKVDGSSNEAFNGITVTSLTGYMYANNTSPVTASTTIPVASVTGAVPNTVNVLASGLLSGGGALTGNVTIGLTSVPSGNVTGLGTMATQNANAVAITGGTINSVAHTGGTFANANITSVAATFPNSYLSNSAVTLGNTAVSLGGTASTVGNLTLNNVTINSGNTSVTYDNAVYQIATANIAPSSNIGAFSYGNLSYSDVGIVASFANSSNTSVQMVMQNTSSGSNASTDIAIVNDTGSAYIDVGIASSTYSGAGAFNKANGAYAYAGSTDLYLGTISSNAVHILANNSNTDAITVNANNTVTLGTPLGVGSGGTGLSSPGTSGYVLTSNGTAWVSQVLPASGVTIQTDSANATRYMVFSNVSTGTVTIENVSTSITVNPSTGFMTSPTFVASNGLVINSNSVSSNVTIATGYNAMSAGNVTVANGVTVTVASGSRWVIV